MLLKFKTVQEVRKLLLPSFPELTMYVTPDPSVEDDSIMITDDVDIQVGYDYLLVSLKQGSSYGYLPTVDTLDELVSQIQGVM